MNCGPRWRSSPPSGWILGAQAVALYKRVLDEDPSSAASLDALERQAERDKDFATVAEVLELLGPSSPRTTPRRLNVLQKLGTIYSERLHDRREGHGRLAPGPHAAAGACEGSSACSVTASPGSRRPRCPDGASTRRTATGKASSRVLSGAADKPTDAPAKVDLSFRCAAIYEERLKTPERAFRAYERVLSVKPDDAKAASALLPLYEKDEKWNRLPALYEILLGHTEDLDGRLDLLGKLIQVTGQHLQDRATAFQWARKAYELAPEREGALATLEKAARSAGQWNGFVDVVTARLGLLDAPSETSRANKKKKKKKDKDKENGETGKRDES